MEEKQTSSSSQKILLVLVTLSFLSYFLLLVVYVYSNITFNNELHAITSEISGLRADIGSLAGRVEGLYTVRSEEDAAVDNTVQEELNAIEEDLNQIPASIGNDYLTDADLPPGQAE